MLITERLFIPGIWRPLVIPYNVPLTPTVLLIAEPHWTNFAEIMTSWDCLLSSLSMDASSCYGCNTSQRKKAEMRCRLGLQIRTFNKAEFGRPEEREEKLLISTLLVWDRTRYNKQHVLQSLTSNIQTEPLLGRRKITGDDTKRQIKTYYLQGNQKWSLKTR